MGGYNKKYSYAFLFRTIAFTFQIFCFYFGQVVIMNQMTTKISDDEQHSKLIPALGMMMSFSLLFNMDGWISFFYQSIN